MALEYIIYADESIEQGDYFSNFYGGALVRSTDLLRVQDELLRLKATLNLHKETKWSKVTENYLDKYTVLINRFFDFVGEDAVKVRIMFTQNRNMPQGLGTYHVEYKYYILYYQFIKHAFGLRYANPSGEPITLRIYLDKLPDSQTKINQFKGFLVGLNTTPEFRNAKLGIAVDQIADVSSHDHVILQCLDIVMGSMQFRLNDKHLIKPVGATQRGKRTIAKEKLYNQISARIRQIYPNFNIGITTGTQGNRTKHWAHTYRHWLFVSNQSKIDETQGKTKQK